MFLVAEGLGLVYALSVGSILGTVFNVFNLVSILVTLYQDSRKSLLRKNNMAFEHYVFVTRPWPVVWPRIG